MIQGPGAWSVQKNQAKGSRCVGTASGRQVPTSILVANVLRRGPGLLTCWVYGSHCGHTTQVYQYLAAFREGLVAFHTEMPD